jgi:hypothetical protein
MTAAEGSYFGIAKQAQKGTAISEASAFDYLLFSRGSIGPNNVTIPLDPEVGGGALLRGLAKVGVMSAGALELIPRPKTLGHFLYGALGKCVSSRAGDTDGVFDGAPLTVGAQTGYTAALIPLAVPSKLSITGHKAGATLTGNVVITGTDTSDEALTETIALNGVATVFGSKVFKSVVSVDLPAWITNGDSVDIGYHSGSSSHAFTLDTDQFSAPYYTVRYAPGNLWGETYQDVRFNALSLDFRGANFLRGSVGMIGGLPAKVATTGWNPVIDGGPQFLSPLSTIELPTGTAAKVLGGNFTAGMAIPMDQQWVVGSYSPDDFDIVSRAFALSLVIKITDATLYSKMMYDPAGADAWAASIFREARIKLELVSDQLAGLATPYKLTIAANGNAGDAANVMWSAQPISIRAGQQVVMNVTGIFMASATAPITVTLVNQQASY